MEETKTYKRNELDNEMVGKTISEVVEALKTRGYDPIDQIVGYLMSGDPGYISSYKDARSRIQEIDRAKIVEILLTEFQKDII